jgi:catalase
MALAGGAPGPPEGGRQLTPASSRVRAGTGPTGPNLLHDAHLIQKLARFVRERVPDRV